MRITTFWKYTCYNFIIIALSIDIKEINQVNLGSLQYLDLKSQNHNDIANKLNTVSSFICQPRPGNSEVIFYRLPESSCYLFQVPV